jgi:hypothetical protein
MTPAAPTRHDEAGQVLLLAMAFIMFVGVIGVALLGYATTSLRATIKLRDVRDSEFAADGAVDGAINALRSDSLLVTPTDPCFTAHLNGQDVYVTCSGVVPGDVILSACLASVPPPCQGSDPLLVAKVVFSAPGPNVAVESWSVRK